MASFTDNIPQFNPYVPQQPVEAMVTVGMMKQQQYDTNLDRIYQSMNNIAGLDVIRDNDKEYLQNKMNSVSDDLRVYAASDFSKSNITRRVNGMVNSIADDEIIQTAVRSSMAVREAQRLQKKFTEEGKGSPSNDWLLGTQLQEWYNNPEVGVSFNGTYKPYSDYNKKAREIVKEVLKDEDIKDTDFKIENGKVVFTDIMVREKVGGKSRARIQQALLAGLTPAEWEQLQVDGRYQYSNVTGEEFSKNIKNSYDTNMGKLNTEKERLELAIKTAKSAVIKSTLQKNLDDINNSILKEENEYEALGKYFTSKNYEGAKAKLFTMDWMNNISNAFSSIDNSYTIHTSPRADFQFKRENEARRRDEYNWDFRRKQDEHRDRMEREDRANDLREQANNIALKGLNGYGPVLKPKDQKEIYQTTPDIFKDEIDIAYLKIDEEADKIAKFYGASDTKAFLDAEREKWKKNPSGTEGKLASFFHSEFIAKRIADTKNSLYKTTMNLSDEKFYPKYKEIVGENVAHSFTYEDGNTYEFTKHEIVNFNEKWQKLKKEMRFMPATGVRYDDFNSPDALKGNSRFQEILKSLSTNEKKLLQIRMNEESDLAGIAPWIKNVVNSLVTSPIPKLYDFNDTTLETDQAISDLVYKLDDDYASKMEQFAKTKREWEVDYITNRIHEMQGQTHNIPLSEKDGLNGSQKDQFKAVLSGLADNIKEMGGLQYSPEVTAENMEEVIPDLDTATISIVEGVGAPGEKENIYSITARDTKGNSVTFRLGEDNYKSIFNGRYELTPELQVFQEYNKAIMANNLEGSLYGSTSTDGKKTNKDNAYMGAPDFPSVKFFGVSGNIITQDGVNYGLELNIYNPISKKWIEGYEYEHSELDINLQRQIWSLDDFHILEIILGHTPTEEEVQAFLEVIKNQQ